MVQFSQLRTKEVKVEHPARADSRRANALFQPKLLPSIIAWSIKAWTFHLALSALAKSPRAPQTWDSAKWIESKLKISTNKSLNSTITWQMFLKIWTCRTKARSKRVNLTPMAEATCRVKLPLAVCSRIGFLWISRMHRPRAELKTPLKSSKSSRWTYTITKWTHNDPRTIPLVPIAIWNKTK